MRLLVGVGLAILLAGCGSQKATTVTAVQTVATTAETAQELEPFAPSAGSEACTLSPVDGGLWLTFRNATPEACAVWAQAEARRGSYWRAPAYPVPHEPPTCRMDFRTPVVAELWEVSRGAGGDQLCAELLAHGWQELR